MITLGIDFGTTKTLAAIVKDGKPIVVRDSHDRPSMPSLVLYTPDEAVAVGWEAKHHPLRYESQSMTIAGIKRLLGKKGEVQHGSLTTRTQEVGALIFARLRMEVEAKLGEAIHEAVVAIPAHFDINQRWAVMQSAEIAGLKVRRLLNEATAASNILLPSKGKH